MKIDARFTRLVSGRTKIELCIPARIPHLPVWKMIRCLLENLPADHGSDEDEDYRIEHQGWCGRVQDLKDETVLVADGVTIVSEKVLGQEPESVLSYTLLTGVSLPECVEATA